MVERPGAVVGGLGDLEELITGDFSLVAQAFRAVGLGACGLAAKGPVGGGGLVLGASEVTNSFCTGTPDLVVTGTRFRPRPPP